MKAVLLLVPLTFASSACGPLHYRTMPRPPVCVVGGGADPTSQSMDDYGDTYAPGVNGPAPFDSPTTLVPEADAGPYCVAPPWWSPPS